MKKAIIFSVLCLTFSLMSCYNGLNDAYNEDSDYNTTAGISIEFLSVVQTGGTSAAIDSSGLTLTFNDDPTSLTVDNITVSGASKGSLTGTGLTRSLTISAITVANNATISVTITSPSGYSISGSPKAATVYRAPYIGMPYQGGIIAYIYQSGDTGYVPGQVHGLIASTANLSTSQIWSNITGESVATDTSLGTGQANTTAIISQAGQTDSAAKLCDEYVNTETGTGVYSDWYLPSLFELDKLYINRTAIGGFINNAYWSSSNYNISTAWVKYFNNGDNGPLNKAFTQRVRAVRDF